MLLPNNKRENPHGLEANFIDPPLPLPPPPTLSPAPHRFRYFSHSPRHSFTIQSSSVRPPFRLLAAGSSPSALPQLVLHLLFTHPPPAFVRLLSNLPHLRILKDRGHGIMLHLLTNFLLFYAGAIMALSLLGRFFKQSRFYARMLSYYFLLLTCTAYGVVASVALRGVGKVSIAQWTTARAFKNVACPLIGIEFEVKNESLLQTRPAVFISNHQTYVFLLLFFLFILLLGGGSACADHLCGIANLISSFLADSSPSTAVSLQRALSNISPFLAGSVCPPPSPCLLVSF